MRIVTQIKFITAPNMAELEQATNDWLANMTGRVQSVKYLYQKNAEGAEHQAHIIYTIKDTETEQETHAQETERLCSTCRYFALPTYEVPCCKCDIGRSKWEPEEETP